MKKAILFLSLVAAFAFAPKASAQDNPFSAGNIMATAYTGLPTQFKGVRVPPVGLTVEYGIADFGRGEYGTIGAGLAYEARMNRRLYEVDGNNYNIWVMQLAPYACYHYFFNASMEVHAKAGFGWNNYETLEIEKRRVHTLATYDFIGATFFFTPALAATAEIGWSGGFGFRAESGVAFMHLGVSYVF